ncbi:MAG: nickel-dependent hydrogenase large subunit [Thiolinea sp.]
MSKPATRKLFGPFNRVEGDLEVSVDIIDGKVASARVNSPLYRGFEQILQGKDPRDALVYTPRICGICSVAQSVAAARALADAQGLEAARNGQLANNLILAAENAADHLTHFYLFFMPDFARDAYRQHHWHHSIQQRFAAQKGSSAATMLKARAELLHLTGILAGKWPHSLSIQPGGSSRSVSSSEKMRLGLIIAGFRQFLETHCFADKLERVLALDSPDQLREWAAAHADADFSRFLQLSDSLQLAQSGRLATRLMSYGAYEQDGRHLFPAGVWTGQAEALNAQQIREDISHSWMRYQNEPQHPFQGTTEPDIEQADGYSWCKAPRLDGRVMEVGALARQAVAGQALVRQLLAESGSNVQNRVIARLLELAALIPAMEDGYKQLQPGQPFCAHAPLPQEAEGQGMIEAARGSLGHWLRIYKGRILSYQIIAPTTWNFSPRDSAGQPGALEQALQGTEVGDAGENSVMIQHIVRSFDPCMVCTVH